MGWNEELEDRWRETSQTLQEDTDIASEAKDAKPEKSKDEELEDEIVTLTREVDDSLKISNERSVQIRDQLKK